MSALASIDFFVRQLYLGFVLDRKVERIRVIASAEGGVEIEDIARDRPESILQEQVDPAVGLQAFQARELAFGLGLNIKQVSQAVTLTMGCCRACRDLDATMVEINPLVVTKDDRVLALEARMSFDDNALFRRAKVTAAATTRGFKEPEVRQLSDWIADVLDHMGDAATIERVRGEVEALCQKFPVYA